MRKKFSKLFVCLCMLLVSSCMIGCNNVKVTLSTENDITSLKPGESTQIIMDIESEDIKLEISDGEEYATLSADGVLTIKTDAKVGEVVTTVAKKNNKVVSNELDITIDSILATGITATADPSATNVDRGDLIELSTTTTPQVITENITWQITEGSNYATIVSGTNLLRISQTAPYNTVIKVRAKGAQSNVLSNELTFTVAHIELTALNITAIPNSTEVVKGAQIAINATKTPANSTEDIEYLITEGSDYVTMADNVLTVKNNAPIGTVITVEAKGETIYSNELTFTVVASPAETKTISITDSQKADSEAESNVLELKVINGLWQEVTGEVVNYTITEGSEYLELDHDNGYTCDLKVLGHGTATVKVSVAGATDKYVTVNCVKVPESISIPEALTSKVVEKFTVGVNQEMVGFDFEATGTNVCQDLVANINKKDGSVYKPSTSGTLVDGKLKFTEIGDYELIISSNAGSVKETTRTIKFTVNEGVNVNTYEDFKANVVAGNIVNIMNLTNKNGSYNYDLVPSFVLDGSEVANSYTEARIDVKGKRVEINGNGYSLDLSGMKYFEANNLDYGTVLNIVATDAESNNNSDDSYNIQKAQTQDQIDAKKRNLSQADYFVKINDLSIFGNCHVNATVGTYAFDMTDTSTMMKSLVIEDGAPSGELRSSFNRGIKIGDDDVLVAYQVSMNNVNIGGFNRGLRICHAVNSTISNAYVGDCFVNGIESVACEMTLNNMTYGLCGAAGIEITPDRYAYAGLNFSKDQTITFAGSIFMDRSALNNGATPYFTLYSMVTHSNIVSDIKGAMIYEIQSQNAGLTEEEIYKRMLNVLTDISEPSMGIIALIFNDGEGNNSKLEYSNEMKDGIVKLGKIQENDIHKYVEVNLQTTGRALLFNLAYLPQED